jgi:Short C-terminal domain
VDVRLSASDDRGSRWPGCTAWLEWGEPGRATGSMGKIRKIERLQKLRESGALTDAEFQREKAKILAES